MCRAARGWAALLGLCCLAALLGARGASGQDDDDKMTLSEVESDSGVHTGSTESLSDMITEPADPFAEIEEAAMTRPALTYNKVNIQFEGGRTESLEVKPGDIPAEVAAAFAQKHAMGSAQEKL